MARTLPKLVATLALALLVVGRPAVGRAGHTPGEEAGLALAAAGSNLVYAPAKTIVALIGLPVGALTGFLTLGDTRAAYAIWVPTVGGTYFLRPANMDGSEPIEFFGSDYADTPSTAASVVEFSDVYNAMYSH
jgi:hypothetical protein